jgi:hypothetical protein
MNKNVMANGTVMYGSIPSRAYIQYEVKAPSIISSPWARFTTPITPKMSENPAE